MTEKCPRCGKDLCSCDDPEGPHCSDSQCGWDKNKIDGILTAFKTNLLKCPVCGSPLQFDDDERGTFYGFCTSETCNFKAEVDYW